MALSIPDTHGFIRAILGTDRAAGSAVQELAPTNGRWLLHSVQVTLVTDATAVVRTVFIALIANAVEVFRIHSQVTQAASLSQTYNFIAGGPDRAALSGTFAQVPLPLNLLMDETWQLQISAINFQAGDDFGAPELYVEEWIEQ